MPDSLAPSRVAPCAETQTPVNRAVRRPTAQRLRLRRRAVADAVLALLLVPAALMLSSDPYTQVRLAILAVAFGLLGFMIRRSQDLAAIRADVRARDAAMEGRGISIGDWHAGRPLAPWTDRTAHPIMADPQEPA